VAAGFAVIAAIVAGVLAGATYLTTRSFLLEQREEAALSQALVNGRLVRDALRAPEQRISQLLDVLPATNGAQPLLRLSGRWYGRSVALDGDALPSAIRRTVASGGVSRQRFRHQGEPYLAVGVALPATSAEYFEVVPLRELEGTLRTIGASLAVGAAVAALGAAAVGFAASRRVLRPLGGVTSAARRLAGGDLRARVEESDDPELAPLVRSFNEMADSLEERISRDARFASDVSHEMRSPLTSLRNALELAHSRLPPLDERASLAMDLLDTQVERFERIVLELLEISRLDAGVGTIDASEEVLADVVTRIVHTVAGDQVPVVIEPGAADAVALVDVRRLERILGNILDNARIHGGGAVQVVLETASDRVRIMVDDAGPGIPPAERHRVFERFARGSTARHRAGSGLGLSLVQEHVRVMGGSVHATGSPAGGARFVVELPFSPGARR
jgi:signal transduction histidine kinase